MKEEVASLGLAESAKVHKILYFSRISNSSLSSERLSGASVALNFSSSPIISVFNSLKRLMH